MTARRVAGVRKKVISKWSKAGLADKLEIMEDSVQRELRSKYKFREQWPSTGIISMVYALRHYNAPIYITGFDFRGARKKDCSWTVHALPTPHGLLPVIKSCYNFIMLCHFIVTHSELPPDNYTTHGATKLQHFSLNLTFRCHVQGCTSKILGHWFQKNYKSSTVHNMYAEGNFIKTLSKRGLIKVL